MRGCVIQWRTSAVIYVCRNVKDAAVSFYHHMHMFMYAIDGSFEEFAGQFKDGLLHNGGYFKHLKVRTRILGLFESLRISSRT